MGAKAKDPPAPAARPGFLIDGRYRLEQVRAEHASETSVRTVLWRAVDESLERRVAVLLVTGLKAAARTKVLKAAARASRVSDARFVRILDTGTVDLDAGATTWVATEWVTDPSLAATVRGEPLREDIAIEIVRQCADAMSVAERAECAHGRLHPDQILLPAGGLPRITGLEVAAALHGEDATPGDDVRALGGVLFAAVTGRWPLPGWSGLPGVDERTARQARPRLVRAGISGEVDEIAHNALTGRYPDVRALRRALDVLPRRPLDLPEPPPVDTGPTLWQRWSWRVVPPLVVLAIGLAGWALGSDLGRVPTTARQPRAAVPPADASAPGTARAHLLWRRPPDIRSFDPEGDGEENEDAVTLAVDRDGSTAWETDLYRSNGQFGGLKSGVGVLLDLHRPVRMSVAELALDRAGAGVEIRAGDQLPQKATDLTLVASRSHAPTRVRMTPADPVTARYWLVWFTTLPADAGGYRIGLAEVALLG